MRLHMFYAENIYRAFKEALPLTGIVLTKLGGAALSMRQITGAPKKTYAARKASSTA